MKLFSFSLLTLAVLATLQPSAQAADAPPAAAAASAPAAPARPPDPNAPKPFADVIRDAQRQDGFIPVWRKDDKVWLEVAENQIGVPFMLSVNIHQSVGERGLYGSQMGPDWMVEFRRHGNTLRLVALNNEFRAGSDAASRAVVAQGFSNSLIGAGPVASAAHPERKSVLMDAAFLLGDVAGYSTLLDAAFRMPFSLDRGNSYFENARSEDGQTTLAARLHFAVPRLPTPSATPSPGPQPTPPSTVPDPRSLFVGVTYNLFKLPEQPMASRRADQRLGHFTAAYTDFSNDMKAQQRVHSILRWRLEKKDPNAALSEPVTPITYWLDRNIPVRYRAAVEAGVLEWNKAFEKIGFKNAIVVKHQPDDATWDNMDASHASIRWFVGADVGFAIGPSTFDPRSGEILDADIGMSDVFGRGARRLFVEDMGARPHEHLHDHAPQPLSLRPHQHTAACTYAAEAALELEFAIDLMEARGDIAPDSPEAEAFVQEVIKDTIIHEVGHTLGLKHNFKASTTITAAQLRDPQFTQTQGISGSVMDYNPYNLALRGEPRTAANQTGLGPYDYWAIEYAYKPLAAADEAAELARVAGRSTEPALAFADDADADGPNGIDPTVNRFDLGEDPLAWYQRRLNLSRELWQRVQERSPQTGDDPLRARRSLASGFRQLRNMPELVAKFVGGMYITRDQPGPQARPNYRPVEPERQREALRFLATNLFAVDSFRFKPEFLAAQAPDYNEWTRSGPLNIPAVVLALQAQGLDRLMAAGTAERVLDLPSYLPEARRKTTLTLDEVYGSVQAAVWSELRSGGDIERMRRSLQREHLKRLQNLLTRPPANMPADALSLLRWHAVKLQAELKTAAARAGAGVDTRAHLQESLATLTEALRAAMSRS